VCKIVFSAVESKPLTISGFIECSRIAPYDRVRQLAILMFAIGIAVPTVAQHPYLWFDSTQRALMRDKVDTNSADWQAL